MPERHCAVFRFLLLITLFLTACSINTSFDPAKKQNSSKWRSHQQSVSRLNSYQTRGIFAYFSQDQKVYACFNWQQTSADRYRLILTNPLGSTEMDLNVQPNLAQLVNNQGKRYVSDNLDMMIKKLVGISIPINDLRQWMLGLPGDASDFTIDARGYLHQVNYSRNGQHWTVTYQGYYDDIMPALPSNLELRQGNNFIKLKINTWSL